MKSLFTIALLFLSNSALANIELRAHYGQLSNGPEDFNKAMDVLVVNNPDIKGPASIGGDLVLVSAGGYVLGVRHETFAQKVNGPVTVSNNPMTASAEFKGSRTSALLGYRLLNLPMGYLGLLAHYGVGQKLEYSETLDNNGAASTSKYTISKEDSYGIAIETGMTYGFLLIGGEFGYTSFKGKDVKDQNNGYIASNGEPVEFDLSGPYFKAMLGFVF